MESLLSDLLALLPEGIDWTAMGTVCLAIGGGFLLLAVLFRIIKGKLSDLNHALSSGISILILFALAVVIHAYAPGEFSAYLSPLPFATFRDDCLLLFSFFGHDLTVICHQILSMIILAFLVKLPVRLCSPTLSPLWSVSSTAGSTASRVLCTPVSVT